MPPPHTLLCHLSSSRFPLSPPLFPYLLYHHLILLHSSCLSSFHSLFSWHFSLFLSHAPPPVAFLLYKLFPLCSARKDVINTHTHLHYMTILVCLIIKTISCRSLTPNTVTTRFFLRQSIYIHVTRKTQQIKALIKLSVGPDQPIDLPRQHQLP